MSKFARKIVSGRKARFKDHELNVDLDLSYLTDRIIIMGYPATGVAAIYRNDRQDVRRFLDRRHANKYWIFNFCPLAENSYDPAFFYGRVSRYPFPDHHAPPLALIALAVREMHSWLSEEPERVIVVHCKAGKGRSGTLACAYLLTLEMPFEGRTVKQAITAEELASRRAEELIDQADEEMTAHDAPVDEAQERSMREIEMAEALQVKETKRESGAHSYAKGQVTVGLEGTGSSGNLPLSPSTEVGSCSQFAPPSLEHILDLHTRRRMKPMKGSTVRSQEGGEKKYGVSIASQRRSLQYWALLLSGTWPPRFWSIPPVAQCTVLINSITIRMKVMHRTGRTTVSLLSAALSLASQQPAGEVWASIARYDPAYEEMLESKERETRDLKRGIGRGRYGCGLAADLETGEWDKRKMIKSFARVGCTIPTKEDENLVYVLQPLPPEGWMKVEKSVPTLPDTQHCSGVQPISASDFENDSMSADDGSYDAASMLSTASNQTCEYSSRFIPLPEGRAVRVKLFYGQIPMGWFWFIPAFEMMRASNPICRYQLKRSELDFARGAGAWIVDVETQLRWA